MKSPVAVSMLLSVIGFLAQAMAQRPEEAVRFVAASTAAAGAVAAPEQADVAAETDAEVHPAEKPQVTRWVWRNGKRVKA